MMGCKRLEQVGKADRFAGLLAGLIICRLLVRSIGLTVGARIWVRQSSRRRARDGETGERTEPTTSSGEGGIGRDASSGFGGWDWSKRVHGYK